MPGEDGDHAASQEPTDVSVQLSLGATVGQGTSGQVASLLNVIDGGRYVVKKVQLKKSSSDETERALQEVRLHRMVAAGCSAIVRYAFSNLAGKVLLVCMEACDFPLWDALTGHGSARCGISVGSLTAKGTVAEREQLKAQRTAITAELCAAVRHCHDLRVLHRDINPWNVFLARREGAGPELATKLGDFGLAVCLPEGVNELKGVTADGAVELDESALGSLYSAPELGKQYTFAADVFSAGMTLLALWSAASCQDEETLILVTEDAKSAASNSTAPSWDRGSAEGKESEKYSLIRCMVSAAPSARPAAPDVCAGFGRACEDAIAKSSEQLDIENCFKTFLGEKRLVTWGQLSKVVSCCGLSDASLVSLEAVWGKDIDGVLDYTLFLDWLFQQDGGILGA